MSKKRIWLNPVTSYDNGWMKYGVQQDDDGAWDADLIIADCNKQVSFGIGVYSKSDRKKTLRKLRVMRNALSDMITQVEEIGK